MNSEKKNLISLVPTSPTCETKSDQTTIAALAALSAIAVCISSCKKEQVGVFELTEVPLVSTAAEKDKLKTNQQFVSILYTNLFQSAISGSDVFELDQLFQSVGDSEVAKEVLISNFFNESNVQLPTVAEMNADLEAFIVETYKRFFVRLPNEAEKAWVRNFIQSNPYMTPELVYFSFALSNEYQFY
ncbi:MAG: hypothetical protein K1X54_02575 [Flavobacteriales bacterium]|nr:hypothetical protein [Flavobacteriales bacterium]